LPLHVVPCLVPSLLAFRAARRAAFLTVSQTAVDYRGSALSEGRAGGVHGGDRLPWVQVDSGRGADNFAPLRSLDWQVHVYGEVSPGVRARCAALHLALHPISREPPIERAG